MPQQRMHAASQSSDSQQNQEQPQAQVSQQQQNTTAEQVDALDAILDDISTVLETNAQEYVDSFVQKGGQ
ncbi:Pup-like protein [Bifidobacterium dolichotidis]|uniref:Prokaryotic ubiquitin-like protein Pup n=1 Tax=Bifidobacterium dolichotidis TaxID=2306976 RepID=A0A430FPK0_9BIFI|nr:ubiquitin-like protein Pup [Bifidobacterium dolichotidis]RSX54746.1 Pup-like protein [Bifidobacterium dolichotidis]